MENRKRKGKELSYHCNSFDIIVYIIFIIRHKTDCVFSLYRPSAQHIPPSWLPHVPFSTFSVPPPEVGYYEAIAKEAESVFHTEEDFWNLQSLDKLSRTDSAIRESMRRTPHSGRGMMKEVVHPNDVTLPDGQKIPLGVWLGVSKLGIGHDERYYPDPHKYDPFRFSRARTEIALMETNGKNDNTDYAATTTTTTTMDKVVGNEKNSVDVDYSKEQVIGKFNGTGDHNPKLNCSWLSTVAEDFGVFGLGRHSWYVFFSFPDARFRALRFRLLSFIYPDPNPPARHF